MHQRNFRLLIKMAFAHLLECFSTLMRPLLQYTTAVGMQFELVKTRFMAILWPALPRKNNPPLLPLSPRYTAPNMFMGNNCWKAIKLQMRVKEVFLIWVKRANIFRKKGAVQFPTFARENSLLFLSTHYFLVQWGNFLATRAGIWKWLLFPVLCRRAENARISFFHKCANLVDLGLYFTWGRGD